jgi:hypothetical protein
VLTLPLCRTPHGQYTGSRHADPGLTSTPGFDVIWTVSTIERQFTFVRLQRFSPDAFWHRFRNAHDRGF